MTGTGYEARAYTCTGGGLRQREITTGPTSILRFPQREYLEAAFDPDIGLGDGPAELRYLPATAPGRAGEIRDRIAAKEMRNRARCLDQAGFAVRSNPHYNRMH